MTAQELKKLLDEAEASPEQIAKAVTGLPAAKLHHRPAPGKWCILEILCHLADMELVQGYRIRQLLADKDPAFAPIDQDEWARNLAYMEAAPAEMVAQYALNRRMNLRLLRRLKPADLEKSAYHPEHKRQIRLEELVRALAAHGPNHLQQIERLKKQAA